MSASNIVRQREAYKGPVDIPPQGPSESPDNDSYECPDGSGRNALHQVLGIQLIDGKKKLWFIPYGAIIWGEGIENGTRFEFDAFRGDVHYKITIEGSMELQSIIDRMTAGKRISIRVNGDIVKRIAVEPVQTKE